MSNDSMPWAVRRDGVKDDRSKVPFWLQDEHEDRLGDVKREVEEHLGYDVYLTDFKEAAILHGLENPYKIATQLDEWGCEHT